MGDWPQILVLVALGAVLRMAYTGDYRLRIPRRRQRRR